MGAVRSAKGLRFDIKRLRALAGATTFERGEEYHRDGQVELLAVEPHRVLALVAGSEDYRTEVSGSGADIDGWCSCPAFGEWGFCKHMVAVGLAANETGDAEAASGGALARIREYLGSRSAEFLADMIVKLAEQDTRLFRRLELAAALLQGEGPDVEARLGKAIDGATHTAEYVDFVDPAAWAAAVDEVLDAVETLASGPQAALALRLAERAIDRVQAAIESIDDSDGHCGALIERALHIHLTAASVARPEPVGFARDLFARETGDELDVFCGAAERYAEALGEAGLAEYRRLAVAEWGRRACGSRTADEEWPVARDRLFFILDFFAERDGDLDKRIALRTMDLSSPYQYLQLAQFCLDQGRHEQALKYAEEGLWMFEGKGQDGRLVLFAADLLAKADRAQDAEAHLWAAFETDPDLDLYERLRQSSGDAARKRAVAWLEARCPGKSAHGESPLAATLLDIHLLDKAYDEAWAALRKFGGAEDSAQRLARATEKTHTTDVIELYQAQVEQLAQRGVYSEAARLITRMAELRGANAQNAYVAALKERHKRKRTFLKLLK